MSHRFKINQNRIREKLKSINSGELFLDSIHSPLFLNIYNRGKLLHVKPVPFVNVETGDFELFLPFFKHINREEKIRVNCSETIGKECSYCNRSIFRINSLIMQVFYRNRFYLIEANNTLKAVLSQSDIELLFDWDSNYFLEIYSDPNNPFDCSESDTIMIEDSQLDRLKEIEQLKDLDKDLHSFLFEKDSINVDESWDLKRVKDFIYNPANFPSPGRTRNSRSNDVKLTDDSSEDNRISDSSKNLDNILDGFEI